MPRSGCVFSTVAESPARECSTQPAPAALPTSERTPTNHRKRNGRERVSIVDSSYILATRGSRVTPAATRGSRVATLKRRQRPRRGPHPVARVVSLVWGAATQLVRFSQAAIIQMHHAVGVRDEPVIVRDDQVGGAAFLSGRP